MVKTNNTTIFFKKDNKTINKYIKDNSERKYKKVRS